MGAFGTHRCKHNSSLVRCVLVRECMWSGTNPGQTNFFPIRQLIDIVWLDSCEYIRYFHCERLIFLGMKSTVMVTSELY